jgi:integrase
LGLFPSHADDEYHCGCPSEGRENLICNRLKKTGIKDLRIHDLRHTAASWLVMEGVPLLQVSRLLGHRSITQTEHYAHLAPESSRALVEVLAGNADLSSMWTTKRQLLNQR